MIKRIVIINGCGGVGKDTFIDLCSQCIDTVNYSSVKEIKEVATTLGWSGGKSEKDRKFLADLKQLSMNYNQYPLRCTRQQIRAFEKSDVSGILFLHIRNIPEIEDLIVEYPDIKTLLITSTRIPKIESNIADADVDNFNYDWVITNDGSVDELKQKAQDFVWHIVENA